MRLVNTHLAPAPALALTLLSLFTLPLAGCASSPDIRAQRSLLNRYSAAVEANKPAEAYALLGKDQQRDLSLDAFKRRWKSVRPELKEQALSLSEEKARPHRVKARVATPTGLDFHLVQEDGQWRISRGYPGSLRSATPEEALRSFILAVEQEDLQGALQLLSRTTRLRLQSQLTYRLKTIKEALKGGIEASSDRAQLRYDARRRVRLVKEKGQWRIQDLDW